MKAEPPLSSIQNDGPDPVLFHLVQFPDVFHFISFASFERFPVRLPYSNLSHCFPFFSDV